jgi:hypothetical protein
MDSGMILGLDLDCQHCTQRFYCCYPCWRGHVCCSKACSVAGRAASLVPIRRRYAISDAGCRRSPKTAEFLSAALGDAQLVLTALDASGLRPSEFARRSGVHVKRLWNWRRRLGQPRSGVRSLTPPAEAARIVELVPDPPNPRPNVE